MTELTVERLFSDPPLVGGVPQSARFTPDGRFAVYLRVAEDDRERLDLWRVELASGTHSRWIDGASLSVGGEVTAAEQAERERRRQFAGGITRFEFSADGRHLLLPVDGAALLLELDSDTLRRVTPPDTRQTDIRFSPDGRQLSYVRDGDLYRYDLASDHEVRLTADGGGPISNGIADFIAQEEMHRFDGHWWSPDGSWLAFTRVDESTVETSRRFEVQADRVDVVEQRYPYTGAANADVRLLVMNLKTGISREVPYRIEDDDYLARVNWLGDQLLVQRQARDQRTLDLVAFEPASGNPRHLLSETSPGWVNLHDNLRPLTEAPTPGADLPAFLWTSERTGSSRLYVYRDGQLDVLDGGAGRVNQILWSDERRALVSGWQDAPTEQHVFEIDLQGEAPPRRLTGPAGWHEATVQADGRRLLDRFSNLDIPGRLDLLDLAGPTPVTTTLVEERLDDGHPYRPFLDDHVSPQLGSLAAEDGQRLHYRLTRPRGAAPQRGHPAIVYVYGGPGVHRVKNEWPPLLLQLFVRRGYAVLELDNRGSSNRERAFELPLHGRLGDVEVQDQLRGARLLAGLDGIDGERIGVFGHSYGGYMTLMCLLEAPDVFKAGVAVAPVTDWHLYDTHYTERYLGTPEGNPAGYRDSDVVTRAATLRNPLLLVHGMADDNVLFTHTTRLMSALQSANRPFEMMAYPGSRHALQERTVSIHRFNLLFDFFARHL